MCLKKQTHFSHGRKSFGEITQDCSYSKMTWSNHVRSTLVFLLCQNIGQSNRRACRMGRSPDGEKTEGKKAADPVPSILGNNFWENFNWSTDTYLSLRREESLSRRESQYNSHLNKIKVLLVVKNEQSRYYTLVMYAHFSYMLNSMIAKRLFISFTRIALPSCAWKLVNCDIYVEWIRKGTIILVC